MRENILESVLDTLFEDLFNVFFMRILILKNPLGDQIIWSKAEDIGAGVGNRALVYSLRSCLSTMELHLQRERGGAGSAGKKRMAKSWTAK